ncbi:MAG: ParA family protein [Pseudomonadota bacterium]
MKVIAFVSNKLGVGKTTCSRALAEYLSNIKKIPTLAIDFDPQGHFSQHFLVMQTDAAVPANYKPPVHPDFNPNDPDDADWDGVSSIAEIFYGEGVIPYPTNIKNLDVAPAHSEKLRAAETVRKSEAMEKVHNRLADFLSSQDVRAAYQAVVIDTGPAKGPLAISVMKAATHIVIPAVMEEKSVEGIYGMLQLWMQEALIREKHRPLKLVGILPTLFKSHGHAHKDLLAGLQDNIAIGKYVMPVKLSERGAFAKAIFDVSANQAATEEALEVCNYITEKVFAHD